MQMVSSGITCAAHKADHLSLPHLLTHCNGNGRAVRIYAVERIVRRGLREMELSVTPEADYSVEQKADVKESGQPKPGKVKKAAQPERE